MAVEDKAKESGIDWSNPKIYTTPIGAALGVALTRAIVPKKDLNLSHQLLGGGLGGAGGYVAGDYMAALPSGATGDIQKDRASLREYYSKNVNTGTISEDTAALIQSAYPEAFKTPVPTEGGVESSSDRSVRSMYEIGGRQRMSQRLYAIRSQIQKGLGQSDAAKKSMDRSSGHKPGAGDVAEQSFDAILRRIGFRK